MLRLNYVAAVVIELFNFFSFFCRTVFFVQIFIKPFTGTIFCNFFCQGIQLQEKETQKDKSIQEISSEPTVNRCVLILKLKPFGS